MAVTPGENAGPGVWPKSIFGTKAVSKPAPMAAATAVATAEPMIGTTVAPIAKFYVVLRRFARPNGRSACRGAAVDRVRNLRVKGGETAVEGREASAVMAGEGGQVGVCDLTMTEHAGPADLGVAQIVRPKGVLRMPA
jgi:hypothetical protein